MEPDAQQDYYPTSTPDDSSRAMIPADLESVEDPPTRAIGVGLGVDARSEYPRLDTPAMSDPPGSVEKPNGVEEDQGPDASADEHEHLHGVRLIVVIVSISLAAFLMLLDSVILVPAVPKITTDFHSITDIGWYGAAYELGSAVVGPLTGKIYANFPVKGTFLAFGLVFELGSVLSGAATSSNMLIVGRTVAGIGYAGIQNGALTVIAACAPIDRRPTLTGVVIGISSFGLVLGPLIGGALTQYTTWRWCFYINVPCGVVVGGILALVRIPELAVKPKRLLVLRSIHTRLDLGGASLFASTCVMLLLAVQWGGNAYEWTSSVIIGLFVGSGVNFLVWLTWDWYQKESALIPLSIVSRRTVWSAFLTYGLVMATSFCTSYYLPLYFQAVRGASPALSGVYMLPSILAQLLAAVVSGRLVQRFGYYLPFSLFGSVCMSVGYGLLSTLTPSTATAWVGYQILFGFGRGTGLQMPLVAVQNNTPPEQIPITIALTLFGQTFLGTLFLSFSDTIFTNTLRSRLREALPLSAIDAIIASGGAGFRTLVSPTDLSVVLSAYTIGIDRIFYMLAALSTVSFFTAFGTGWVDIRTRK